MKKLKTLEKSNENKNQNTADNVKDESHNSQTLQMLRVRP